MNEIGRAGFENFRPLSEGSSKSNETNFVGEISSRERGNTSQYRLLTTERI